MELSIELVRGPVYLTGEDVECWINIINNSGNILFSSLINYSKKHLFHFSIIYDEQFQLHLLRWSSLNRY